MSISIHPAASAAFNEKANALLQLVEEAPRPPPQPSSFPSDVHVAITISEHQIIGDLEESLTDYQGNTVARFFHVNGKRYGLEQKSYKRLRDIASTISSSRGISAKLSTTYVEKILFFWIRDTFSEQGLHSTFSDALTLAASRDVILSTSWIPIAELEIEIPFSIGTLELRPVSTSVIDEWEAKALSMPGMHRESAAQLFLRVRKQFQGRAAAVITMEAEPNRAFEIAVDLAELATSLLAIFSPGVRLPYRKCLSRKTRDRFI